MSAKKQRMTGIQRREQLIGVARSIFASKGYDATSVEEIAKRAGVTKPVVYEHFGGKQGVYAVIVDREVQALTGAIADALREPGPPRAIVERATLALLSYIERDEDGFRVLMRDVPVAEDPVAEGSVPPQSSFSSILGDIAASTEHLLAEQFKRAGYRATWAPLYAQLLVGSVAQVGQWWLEERKPSKQQVAAHVVNLTWNGLKHLSPTPSLKDASQGQ